uniref:Uncharacterized protein n=1 Tax=Arundo donax TaxID=35708 RepID=A0A0A9T420_ARUDO
MRPIIIVLFKTDKYERHHNNASNILHKEDCHRYQITLVWYVKE